MIIVDTGFWISLFNDKDQYHQRAKKTLAKYSSEPLVITWSVLTENCHLLLQRSITKQKGVEKQVQLINLFDQYPEMFKIFNIREHHFPKMKELMKKYANLPIDLADASLIVLVEDLGDGRILSVDNRDFNAYRWKQTYPFTNLFFDYE
ncbi:PIN domain-containing protein [Cyanobacterium aponinum AL20118]|uniref:PIN domain-containing protein n=1 Tax=Cyanobacterium aponinum AL20115 TaxID=3090662 RepID=A0AAF0ZAU8_9CHRO|nr:PIN domain-containing protein [Cyanobacterium aponinum]WPF88548.1 PIN domain-containing protein [Cyanobacterium aponinum AL20115]